MTEKPICRFCLDSRNTKRNPLLQPCSCRGSVAFVHRICLNKWRNQHNQRNPNQCELCGALYRIENVEGELEIIPPETGYVFLSLRYPAFLGFLMHYAWIFHMGLQSLPRADITAAYSLYLNYQNLVQLVYFGLFIWKWSVKNKNMYWRGWVSDFRWLIPIIHLMLIFLMYSDIWMAGISIDFYLVMYWRGHNQILQSVNEELLGI